MLRNGDGERGVKAVLWLRHWGQKWKTYDTPKGFPYEDYINEVEWADDNSTDIFKEAARSQEVMSEGEHMITLS
jgi:hypothetical protein